MYLFKWQEIADTSPLRASSNYAISVMDSPSSLSSTASVSSSSSPFWIASRATPRKFVNRAFSLAPRRQISKRQIAVLLILCLAFLISILPTYRPWRRNPTVSEPPLSVLRPASSGLEPESKTDPVQWLVENSNNKHAVNDGGVFAPLRYFGRPRAALISLVRNTELEGIQQSMRQLEYRWNHKYRYPWVFFNDEPFTEEFKVHHLLTGVSEGSPLTLRRKLPKS
jgi:alpha 1,2-mannosyltransferase